MVDGEKGLDEDFVVVIFVEASAIPVPDLAKDGAGALATAETKYLIGSFFLEEFRIQTSVNDQAQIHAYVNVRVFNGQGIRVINHEVILGVVVDRLVDIYPA